MVCGERTQERRSSRRSFDPKLSTIVSPLLTANGGAVDPEALQLSGGVISRVDTVMFGKASETVGSIAETKPAPGPH